MAKLYGQIGCLTQLLEKLRVNGINNFKTLDHIRIFRNNYSQFLIQIKEKQKILLEEKIAQLESEYSNLFSVVENKIAKKKEEMESKIKVISEKLASMEKNRIWIKNILAYIKKKYLLRKKETIEYSFNKKIKRYILHSNGLINNLRSEIKDKKENKEKWLQKYTSGEMEQLKKILTVFKENRSLFYGAEGEYRVVQRLSSLSDAYHVINDYQLKLYKPIYDKRNDDRIYSVQIDHLVVGPTGVFLIETKNWSKQSIENLDLFSPVKQARRHGFAMFVLLNQAIERGNMYSFSNHWGDVKVSPKNIILLVNHKPQQEFQFVKILSLEEINNYIAYGKEAFTKENVEEITEHLTRKRILFLR